MIAIGVLQRGWVVVGRYELDGWITRFRDASVIRRWGTDRGLGQLTSGPTARTVLDPIGTVETHTMCVVFVMTSLDQQIWGKVLDDPIAHSAGA